MLYLRPREAAAYLNISESKLAKLRVYGGGPVFHKIGRAVRYKQTDLDAFVDRHAQASTSHSPAETIRKAAV